MSAIDRRRFLGLAAGGTLAGLTAATAGLPGTRAYAAVAGRTSFKALVIGSGFGGAVAALRLGQAGVDTLILERGKEWRTSPTAEVFSSQNRIDNRAFWRRWTADWPAVLPVPMSPALGVMEVVQEPDLKIACGAAVGGGSIVYTCATVAPQERYFNQIYNNALRYQEFTSTWYPKVRQMLGASPMPADVYNSSPFTHSRIWDAHRRKAGYTTYPIDSTFNWDVIRQEQRGQVRNSASLGETDFGCSNGAKRSLTQNYLPAALATGKVLLQSCAEVTRIQRNAQGKWVVVVNQMRADGSTLSTDTYTSDLLFVCAGTLNTNRLLVAARDRGDLPNLPAAVGEGFGDNGDQYSGYSHTVEAAGVSQGAPSASATFHEREFGLPLLTESWQLLQAGSTPIVQTLTMTVDLENRGNFRYDRLSGKVGLKNWSAAQSKPAADAATAYNTKIMNSNAGVIPVGILWPFTMTAHPLGGVAINKATDGYGRVKGYPGLYCLDGSLIPGNVGGGNPSLSIAALAERGVADIIAKAG